LKKFALTDPKPSYAKVRYYTIYRFATSQFLDKPRYVFVTVARCCKSEFLASIAYITLYPRNGTS